MPRMGCPIDAQLIEQFAEATENYFRAESELSSAIAGSKTGGPSFDEAYWRARWEHENCERAMQAVEQHRAEHHCLLRPTLLPMGFLRTSN
jgi:hypothetical protein